MTECTECGHGLEERGYTVLARMTDGRFHSVDCAERGYRRWVAQQSLIGTYGADEAGRIERQACGETEPPTSSQPTGLGSAGALRPA